MKNQLTSITQRFYLSIGDILYHGKFVLSACAIILVLAIWTGCNPTDPSQNVLVEEVSNPEEVQVAFAGGGWRAHTAHTGWTFALLNNNSNKLDSVFKKVNTLSSNSGGSWFSTMLMYSPTFVTDIEKPTAISTWSNTTNGGWLGGQQNLFDGMSCHSLSGEAFVTCVLGYYSGRHVEWREVVKSLVFSDYSLGELTLDGTRQNWAKGKSLLLASTMLTNNVVLSANGGYSGYGYNVYYQACLGDKFNFHGKDGGSCASGIVPDVTPVTFSSIPSGIKKPLFFPEAGNSQIFNIGYAQQKDNPETAPSSIKNNIISDKVKVVNAAAASSAAVGFAASENVSNSWSNSYTANNSALNFSLKDGIAKYKIADNDVAVNKLASSQIISLADGGPVDNSGVAQLVRFKQLNPNSKGKDFNIVAFDNVQGAPYMTGINGEEVGSDIATLFGKGLCLGGEFCSGFNCDGTCLTVPELQIFEESSINTPVTWSYSNKPLKYKNTPKLIYTKYEVTTTANSSFGIAPNSTGTLHAFTCYYPDAPTVPQNDTKDGSFIAYNDMIQFINEGLNANKKEGLKLLESAMGISK